MDCNNVCGGNALVDECGVCNGPGMGDAYCDCEGNVMDCTHTCGGDA